MFLSMQFLMMLRAKPNDLKRFGIILVMRLAQFSTVAKSSLQCAAFDGIKCFLASEVFQMISPRSANSKD